MGIFIPGGPVEILATNSVDAENARDLVEWTAVALLSAETTNTRVL